MRTAAFTSACVWGRKSVIREMLNETLEQMGMEQLGRTKEQQLESAREEVMRSKHLTKEAKVEALARIDELMADGS